MGDDDSVLVFVYRSFICHSFPFFIKTTMASEKNDNKRVKTQQRVMFFGADDNGWTFGHAADADDNAVAFLEKEFESFEINEDYTGAKDLALRMRDAVSDEIDDDEDAERDELLDYCWDDWEQMYDWQGETLSDAGFKTVSILRFSTGSTLRNNKKVIANDGSAKALLIGADKDGRVDVFYVPNDDPALQIVANILKEQKDNTVPVFVDLLRQMIKNGNKSSNPPTAFEKQMAECDLKHWQFHEGAEGQIYYNVATVMFLHYYVDE